ncbi:MarC family protein [bacterium]|nr:MarC family protein [bacterium]MCG2675937.1 MarC family protein [bacterium]
MLKNILLSFIPLFVAVDAVGILPIFVALTEKFNAKKRRRIILQSLVTAVCLAVGFIFLGKAVFKLLNITLGDFMVAGGVVLFCIAIIDIVIPGKKRRIPSSELGAVPLGTPLIVGPAVLTVSLISLEAYGLMATLISILSNIILAGFILSISNILIKILGTAGSRALSKITSLLLAAIAIMLIRKGITFIVHF